MPAPVVERIVAFCARNAISIVVLALIAGLLCGFYVAGHFAMNSDAESLISATRSISLWMARRPNLPNAARPN
ncbi:MAG: hypothetical protein DME57_02925 [Verrucomicrobia bacterium]|nr:MAG: hypothetical protein DME57_02925 [Verrucomicrobiota bacterium]